MGRRWCSARVRGACSRTLTAWPNCHRTCSAAACPRSELALCQFRQGPPPCLIWLGLDGWEHLFRQVLIRRGALPNQADRPSAPDLAGPRGGTCLGRSCSGWCVRVSPSKRLCSYCCTDPRPWIFGGALCRSCVAVGKMIEVFAMSCSRLPSVVSATLA